MYVLGIDIGGTNVDLGLVNKEGKIVLRGRVKTNTVETPEKMIESIYDEVKGLIQDKISFDEIQGIGIGAPDANHLDGTIINPTNLPWTGVIPFAKMVETKFNKYTMLTNDANAAAIGEMAFGSAKGMTNFIMITLGTGIGSGIVIDGNVVYGNDGIAGELGSFIVDRSDKARVLGNAPKGCLENYCSANGVAYTACEMLESYKGKSILMDMPKSEITSEIIYNAAKKGDELAKRIFDYTGEILGMAIAEFVLFSNPEAIVLFGGLIKSGDMILKPTRDSFEKHVIESYKGKSKILLSTLDSSDAAILGASMLGWK